MVYFIPKNKVDEPVNRKKIKRIFCAALALIFVIGTSVYVFRLDASDFQQVTAEKVERMHEEIRAERYREIFFSNDRRLIVNQDEAELTAMLRQANYFLAQNPRLHCLPPRFEDTAHRARQRFGKPFEIYNSCSLTTPTGATATELFVWRNSRSSELKLAYYELTVR